MKEVLELFRFVDWLLRLPEGVEREYREELRQFEESRRMPYITSIERMGREEGHRAGLQQGRELGRQEGQIEALRQAIVEVVETRFGSAPAELQTRVQAVADAGRLRSWLLLAARAGHLVELTKAIAN